MYPYGAAPSISAGQIYGGDPAAQAYRGAGQIANPPQTTDKAAYQPGISGGSVPATVWLGLVAVLIAYRLLYEYGK